MGVIGRYLIGLLRNFCLETVVFDPFLSDEDATSLGVKKCSLEEIFSTCSVISNHLANNEQTKGMLNGRLFDLMADNATFINTGRGAQVVEADLIRALQEHPNRTALLDVTDPEPALPDSPFYTMDNVFLTPHRAGSVEDEVRRMAEFMVEDYQRVLRGEPSPDEVTLDMLKTMA
ncbi:MAG: NAD(P)-dependent oxidoreductase [Clostridia bacterium]